MKQGKTLMELAAEVQRRQELKKDYVADTRQIGLEVHENQDQSGITIKLNISGHGQFEMNYHAHGQIANHLAIPKKYYDRATELETIGGEVIELSKNEWREISLAKAA